MTRIEDLPPNVLKYCEKFKGNCKEKCHIYDICKLKVRGKYVKNNPDLWPRNGK